MLGSQQKLFAFFLFSVGILGASAHASPPPSRGARPIALGNAYTAVSGDVYSLFYNPAGLYDITEKQMAFDYGRSYSEHESARTDFNALYSLPYRFRDKNYPLTMGVYSDTPADGAHIVDLTAGAAMDAPMDVWTKGIFKMPTRIGLAATIRHQKGDKKSTRVGESAIGLGFTGGLLVPINRQHQMALTIQNLFNPGADADGPSIHFGVTRNHSELLNLFGDLEFGNGGVWRIHPGAEWLLARGVLRPRLGWGFRDNGHIDLLATGVGFYVSPYEIDISYLIPMKTTTDNAGQFRASLIYRFGKPKFSEIYYDRALEAASQLDTNVLLMTTKEAELKSSLSELEQKKRLALEELTNAKTRIEALKDKDLLGERDATIRQLKDRIRDLEGNLDVERNTLREIQRKKNEIRTHVVVAGETLQSIAQDYYGDANQWKRIYSANPDKIDRGLPKVGSSLVIP